jgi:hypothetical protein
MRACGEADILLSNRSGLGKPQTGLKDGQQKRMIAAAQPFIAVLSCQQRIHLRSREKAHQGACLPLVGDHQHALDQSGVLGRQVNGKATSRPGDLQLRSGRLSRYIGSSAAWPGIVRS